MGDGDSSVLESILAGTAVPHQPYVIVTEGSTFSGLPIFRQLITRGLKRSLSTLIVSVLQPPSQLLPQAYDDRKVSLVDLTSSVPGYSGEQDSSALLKRILDTYTSLPSGTQVFIDALDLLAEDYNPSFAIRLVRSLLQSIKSSKAPSRLTLLVPCTSTVLSQLLTPTLSPSLVLLHPLHPALAVHLSQSYLTPIEASPRFWQIIETAKRRGIPEQLAYEGEEGIEVIGDWTLPLPSSSSSSSSSPASSSSSNGAIIQVLIRKPTGGVKGIARALGGITPDRAVVEVSDIVEVNPLARPRGAPGGGGGGTDVHAELELPFNLSLTDEQRRRRAEVEVPYAHEGEGAAEVLWDDEGEDDEEI
ncbi:hypothetical protein BCR39DRAFT_585018 [Naematelia encephala]|uniref:Elongator complex protein 5 n=1 Tax=Naematelia encephala TaxID=71784 RepID=A0A1Y2BKS4_9TREE|nr:hypothetical protein BCR39DRAFT_585018 [Naematelia encephala]